MCGHIDLFYLFLFLQCGGAEGEKNTPRYQQNNEMYHAIAAAAALCCYAKY